MSFKARCAEVSAFNARPQMEALLQFEKTLKPPGRGFRIGLHSGVPVRIRILPAPPSTGIVFVRTDLEGFTIPASWRYVQKVSYATSLMRQGVLISTTEHLLSTFYSMGIDNAFVEIDNLEVPILDGSGRPFVDLIRAAGIRQSRRRKRFLRIRKPVSVEGGGKRITILPSDRFLLTCEVFFPSSPSRPPDSGNGSHARPLRRRTGSCAHLRLRIRAPPDAQYGTDPRRIARQRRVL